MPERDADKMAGKPERGRRVGGGTAESTALRIKQARHVMSTSARRP